MLQRENLLTWKWNRAQNNRVAMLVRLLSDGYLRSSIMYVCHWYCLAS